MSTKDTELGRLMHEVRARHGTYTWVQPVRTPDGVVPVVWRWCVMRLATTPDRTSVEVPGFGFGMEMLGDGDTDLEALNKALRGGGFS